MNRGQQKGRELLTVHCQGQGLCKEGFGVLGLRPLARVDGVLRHQFEEVKEKLVKGAASLKILSIMGSQLEKNKRAHITLISILLKDIKTHIQ